MKNIECNMDFTTNYNFKVFREDKLIQEENTHNVILERVLTKRYKYSPSYNCYAFGTSLHVGNGSGTPSASDTALFNQQWTISTRDSLELVNIDDANNQITARYVFTIPATTSYVGTITECGLYGHFSNYTLYTHALVRDAEGNPISINKTDLDKVIITIDLTLTLGVTDPSIKIVPISKTPFRYALKFNDGSSALSNFHYFNCMCDVNSDTYRKQNDIIHLIQNPIGILQRGVELSGDSYGLSGTYAAMGMPRVNFKTILPADNVRQCTGRVAQNAYAAEKVGYVKAILLFGTFVIPLPNATYFPAYPLNGISVGVASANTTEMLCPLDHFVKDSEVIYKNGVALTRGVDYTVDSDNNHRGLVELTAGNDAIITGGVTTKESTLNSRLEIFRARAGTVSSSVDVAPTFIYAVSTDSPLFFDMQKEVTLNFLRVPAGQNFKYTLYYSENGTVYEQHATVTFTTAMTNRNFEFTPVTARYFKLEVVKADGSSVTSAASTSSSSVVSPDSYFALGYKTDGMIKFTSPLAEGDIITMDCMMDLPYKTDNNVIDYDFSISL